ncbi:Protein Transport Protein Sec31B [Manis pentadactyla]|nr:Protein Transport Protein Sec31B [Manis pentadactyla]
MHPRSIMYLEIPDWKRNVLKHWFHKLIWGSFGNGLLEGSGVIAGGRDNGMLTRCNVTHILSSGKEPVIAQRQKHMGAVRALNFNPLQGWCVPKSLFFMQGNLLASGASDSEIFIWDLNNLSIPMTPGSKSQMHCSGLAATQT